MKLKWDLDCFFPGGSDSKELQKALDVLENRLTHLNQVIEKKADLKKAILELQDLHLHLAEIREFISCLNAQDVTDTKAHLLQDKITQISAQVSNASTHLNEWLASLDDKTFRAHLEEEELKPITFALLERKRLAQEKLPAKEEAFINDLAVDGFHGWSQMWDALIGNMTFPFQGKDLSLSQIENQMADPNRDVRQAAFQSIDACFCQKQTLFAQTLNHLAGYRLAVNRKRKWKNILKEPLKCNRMQEKTLETMWDAVARHRQKLKAYLQCKANLLQVSQLSWCDLEAPIGEMTKKMAYEEAAAFIIKHFSCFSPKMGAFAKDVLNSAWIDAEDRPNKYPGGFCVSFPLSRQSRIFMTYASTMANVFTLAHELGHAYHNFATCHLPGMCQDIRMSVAEMASTMAEITITRAALEEAESKQDRLFILDDHLSRCVAYLMNIYARFLFETRFYAKREKGFVSPEKLSELMKDAQKEAYEDALSAYHPYFWASKMHFQLSDVPFYNFPYTFGYLFSLGLHELGSQEENFEEKYIALLQDTGRMHVEDLARKHLDVDLTKPDFWEMGLCSIDADIETYLVMTSTKCL